MFQRFAAAAEKLPRAQHDAAAALQVLAAALSSDVNENMARKLPEALFSEASRLLFAIIGFTCEGTYPAALRGRMVARAAQSPTWPGVAPQALLGQWFNVPSLLTVFSGTAMREAFKAAQKRFRAQFLCALSRIAFLEVGQQEVRQGRLLRMAWAKVLETFPEVAQVRAILGHIRRRCWEDARDRSRSRSRSRERKKKGDPAQTAVPPGCVRFFVKGCGMLNEVHLETHFAKFGMVWEITILYDKKKQNSRGLAFVTLKPEGVYKGKRNTKEMLRDWVLATTHIVGGLTLDVSEASEKPPEDEERKHEERVEERRRIRAERELRVVRATGVAAGVATAGTAGSAGTADNEERLLLSPWGKRWRQEIFERLPKDLEGPASWAHPRVTELCSSLWGEVVEHIARAGTQEVQGALELFKAESPDEEVQWAYLPGADVLLLVGDGIVGITAEGVFASSAPSEAIAPPSNFDQASLKTVQPAAPAAPAVPAPAPQGPQTAFSSGEGRLQRGGSDREKVFVGGITPSTTLEMLMSYFQRYGKITDAVVMMDKATGKPRGFGFVVYEHVSVVDAVLKDYAIHRLDGKWIEVKRATPQEVVPPGGPGQTGSPIPQASIGAASATAPGSPPTAPVASRSPVPTPVATPVAGAGPGYSRSDATQGSPPPRRFGQVPPPSFQQAPDRVPGAAATVDEYDPLAS